MSRRAIVAIGAAQIVAAPSPADAERDPSISLASMCEHLPHRDVCEGVEPYDGDLGYPRTAATVATMIKLGAIDAPAAVDETQRIYAMELDAWATFGRRGGFGSNLQIGGGSDGGVWLRYEATGGLGKTWRQASVGVLGLGGFDVLSERLGFSLVVGGRARAALRFPRLTVEATADYRYRNYDDLMDPSAPGPNRWLPRVGAALVLGHRVGDFDDDVYYGTRVAMELEEWEGTRVVWVSFGTALVMGPLPR